MKTTSITQRLSGLGGAKWEIHLKAKKMASAGEKVLNLTIGEPDIPTPQTLIDVATKAMNSGRTTYSDGAGEQGLRRALAKRYSQRSGRVISEDQVLCFPGTQTSLFTVLMGIAEAGDEVLVGDPMYATYEGVIRASGADMVSVQLRPENGFRINAVDIEAQITPRSTAILLTTPHNPTGAILTARDIAEIGALAIKHDLWIISDEVYEELVFDEATFKSPFDMPNLAERTIVVSSISKSHAAPGFRSGWCIAPKKFTEILLPLSESMLFGNQPFIADMTEAGIRDGSSVASGMRERYATRAALLAKRLSTSDTLTVHQPEAGMFALLNVTATGMSGDQYALQLLERYGVAVMPGSSFGATLNNWVRIALTVDDVTFADACARIVAHASELQVESV